MARKRSIGEVEYNTRVTLAIGWIFENFHQLDQTDALPVESRQCSTEIDPKTKWSLRLDKVRWLGCDYMSLYLNCETDREVVKAGFSLALIGHRGNLLLKSRFSHDFTKEPPKCGDNIFLRWETMRRLIHSARFTIECEVSYDTGIDASEMRKTKKLVKVLENLYNSRQSSGDVILKVAGKEFRAHKAILRARSPVFDEMFEHSLEEGIENPVKIVDIGEDVFEAVLDFMYTAEIGQKDIDFQQLFVAADFYQMNDLKAVCEEEMASKLSVDTVCDILLFADRYSSPKLKEMAVQFIIANRKPMRATKWWEKLAKNADLLYYVLERI